MVNDFANRITEIGMTSVRWLGNLPYRCRRLVHHLWTGVAIAPGTFIEKGTTIGRRTRINAPSYLAKCSIGSYCAIGGRLIVRSANHETCYLNIQGHAQRRVIGSSLSMRRPSGAGVRIGHGVWIGDSVIILEGVEIGNGAVIGAGSVVTRSVPAYSVAVGNPARVIKPRFPPETITLLEKLEWWNWSDSKLRKNRWLFEQDLSQPLSDALADSIAGLAESSNE